MDLSAYQGKGLKVEDLLPGDPEELRRQQLDAERRKLEEASLEEHIQRLDDMLNTTDNHPPHLLGIRLALEMALELRDKLPLGHHSGKLLAVWHTSEPASSVEEAIAFAREILLRPGALTAEIRQRLFEGRV